METKSPRTEQNKHRFLSLCSQENNIKYEKGFGLDFLVLFWGSSRDQEWSHVWTGKKGITTEENPFQILFWMLLE